MAQKRIRGEDAEPGRCPVCSSQMFGWSKFHPRPAYSPEGIGAVVDRCEECGVAVPRGGAPAQPDAPLAVLLGDGTDAGAEVRTVRLPHRAGIAAAMGGNGWAAFDPAAPAYLSKRSAALLAEHEGMRVRRARTPMSVAALTRLWTTLRNAFALRDNTIESMRAGAASPQSGRERAALGLDLAVNLLVALPLLLVTLVIEAVAVALGHGDELVLELEPSKKRHPHFLNGVRPRQ